MSELATSRRDALRRAAIGAGAVAAASLIRPGAALAQTAEDEALRDFLAEAIAREQIAALAYATAAVAEGMSGEVRQRLELFRDQEQAHANALRSALDELGFDPPEPPDSASDTTVFEDVDGIDDDAAADLAELLESLDGLEGDRLFDYLLELEQDQLAYYLTEGPTLDSEDLSTTAAEIAGCQAQHVYVLRRELGDNPVDALVAANEATDIPSQ